MGYYLIDYENVKKDGLKGIRDLSEGDTVSIFYSENADSINFDLHIKIIESKANINYQKVEVGQRNALDFQLITFLGYLIATNPEEMYYLVTKDSGYQSACNYWKKRNVNIQMVPNLLEGSKLSTKQHTKHVNVKKENISEKSEETIACSKQDERKPELGDTLETVKQEEKVQVQEKKVMDSEATSDSKKAKPQRNDHRRSRYYKVRQQKSRKLAENKAVPREKGQTTSMRNDIRHMVENQQDVDIIADILAESKTKQAVNNALMKHFPSKDHTQAKELYHKIKPLIKKYNLAIG